MGLQLFLTGLVVCVFSIILYSGEGRPGYDTKFNDFMAVSSVIGLLMIFVGAIIWIWGG